MRHHLTALVDSGALRQTLTSWPIDQGQLARSLEQVSPAELSPEARRSYLALSDALGSGQVGRTEAFVGEGRAELRGFGEGPREKVGGRMAVGFQASQLVGRLALSAIDDPLDGDRFRWDESYAAVDLGAWRFGAGRLSRWWGPGWQSSLILSNNARPAPGVFVDRIRSQKTDLPVFRWLGPWSVSAFASQLEEDRHVPEAKLLGARLVFRPHDSLEIGLSRTAQWGGQGRPETASSLWDLILGRDNVGDDGIGEANEPGNQLGGIDWRWSGEVADWSYAFYGQLIGEDEAGGLPSRHIGMVGLEAPVAVMGIHGRIYAELSDTSLRFYDDPLFNSAYNHSIYRSGYRYRGRSLGAASDNDSRLLALGGFHELGERDALQWKAVVGTLNRDGEAGGNPVAPQRESLVYLSCELERELSEAIDASVSVYLSSDELRPGRGSRRAGIQAAVTWEFGEER